MSKYQNTPTPWSKGGKFVSDTPESCAGMYVIRGPDGVALGATWASEDRDTIVRAVNSHAALVEALHAVCERLVVYAREDEEGEVIAQASAALELAGVS